MNRALASVNRKFLSCRVILRICRKAKSREVSDPKRWAYQGSRFFFLNQIEHFFTEFGNEWMCRFLFFFHQLFSSKFTFPLSFQRHILFQFRFFLRITDGQFLPMGIRSLIIENKGGWWPTRSLLLSFFFLRSSSYLAVINFRFFSHSSVTSSSIFFSSFSRLSRNFMNNWSSSWRCFSSKDCWARRTSARALRMS